MAIKNMTGNPSQIIVEQLAASGVKYVFYNSGSREANFFDALHANPDVNGILGLHEGSVTAMAGGYTQVNGDPAVPVVHLGAGLAQCMGQLINVWTGGLPLVIITFAGDTGSFADKIGLDLSHSFGPTSISAPLTKENWTVVEPEGLPVAIDRAIRVAKTPSQGPVHIALYDKLLGNQQVTSGLIQDGDLGLKAGYPADSDLEQLARYLHQAERPLLYIGDGVWKSKAESLATSLAEHFGANVANTFDDLRGVSIKHPLQCGRLEQVISTIEPDLIVAIGARHMGAGYPQDYDIFSKVKHMVAVGSHSDNFKNLPGLELAVLGDERRSLERLLEMIASESQPKRYDERRQEARKRAETLRSDRRQRLQSKAPQKGVVPELAVLDTMDTALERLGGGLITIEQFAVPPDCVKSSDDTGRNVYIRPAGGSEGYGVGAAIGAKLAAPDRPVVGLVGDGSLYYADSALWTAAHHNIPVLYIIPNNQAYGIVANAFGLAHGEMDKTGIYEGVLLDGIDPVKISEAFGVEAMDVKEESDIGKAIDHGLSVTGKEGRPFLLNVHVPVGLPSGGKGATPFKLANP